MKNVWFWYENIMLRWKYIISIWKRHDFDMNMYVSKDFIMKMRYLWYANVWFWYNNIYGFDMEMCDFERNIYDFDMKLYDFDMNIYDFNMK